MEQGPGTENKAENAFLGSDPNNIDAQKLPGEKLCYGDLVSWEAGASSEPCQGHGKYFPPSGSQHCLLSQPLDFPSTLASQRLLRKVEGCREGVEMLLCTNYSRVTIFFLKVSMILTNVSRKKRAPSPSLMALSGSHTTVRYALH